MKQYKDIDINLECDCGCQKLRFTRFEGDEYWIVSHSAPTFNSKQDGIFRILYNRIKMALFILSGKEYRLYEYIILDKNLVDFASNVNNVISEMGNEDVNS